MSRSTPPLLLLTALLAIPAGAQERPDELVAHRAALAAFAWMDGIWRGEAVIRTAVGETRITQTERVGPMLHGSVRVIEGKGFDASGSVVFNAFAVISWDAAAKQYAFRSYSGGYAGTFVATPTAAGSDYVWETPAGRDTLLRYHARLERGRWRETGERIVAGQPARPFFEMTLTRVGDTSWPAARGPAVR